MTKLISGNLLLIIAHPDDETFLAAGLLLANAKSGGVNTVFCATAGEKGSSHLHYKVSPGKLKNIRIKELRAVIKEIPKTKLILANFHDGKLHQEKMKLWQTIQKLPKKFNADMIVSFGADGITGHLDHIAVGEVSQKLAKKLKVPFYAFTYPKKYHQLMPKFLMGRRANPHYTKIATYRKPKFVIKVDSKWKLEMLQCHESQCDCDNPYEPVPMRIAKHLLGNEYFG